MIRFKQIKESNDIENKKNPNVIFPLPRLGETSTPLRRLQENIEQLNSTRESIAPDELWKKYSETFSEYFSSIGEKKSLSIPSFSNRNEDDKGSTVNNDILNKFLLDWIENLPKTYKVSAKNLSSAIRNALNMQEKWKIASNGKLKNGDEVIEGHIIDMLTFAITRRKLETPQGYNQFIAMLEDLNIPKSLLNRKRLIIENESLPSTSMNKQGDSTDQNESLFRTSKLIDDTDEEPEKKRKRYVLSPEVDWLINDYQKSKQRYYAAAFGIKGKQKQSDTSLK